MDILFLAVKKINDILWGPPLLCLLVGTGVFLTIRLKFLPLRNLGRSLKILLAKESRQGGGAGDISPFSALMTSLAATIGTGNIIGVATAMVLGGPGALVWMWIAALFGVSTKYAECMLASKYRGVNQDGEVCGGPMYTIRAAFQNRFGTVLAFLFAVFTVSASFGIGNLTQANSISDAAYNTFSIPIWISGTLIASLCLIIIIGGIRSISKISSVLVPAMALFYIGAGLIVILGNLENVPQGVYQIVTMAFSPTAVSGGLGGTITVTMTQAMRWGVSRGVFSNEAGLGSAAIAAAAARSDHPVRQGYISMCGTFLDTLIVCSITGLVIVSSGVLGKMDESGSVIKGAALTIEAFKTVLGPWGGIILTAGIILFAFSTILGWEYNGEKALEYMVKDTGYIMVYRVVFSIMTFLGAVVKLDFAWYISDIANALMAVPNLICLLLLSGVVARETTAFEKRRRQNTRRRKRR